MFKLATAIILFLAASICLTSCPSCATLDAPEDNPTASPMQIVTAAMYRQAAQDKAATFAFNAAYAESPNTACGLIVAAAAASKANRAQIDAALAALQSDEAAAAADWGKIIDLAFTGYLTTQEVIHAEKNAKAALRSDIPALELYQRFGAAKGNYDASAALIESAAAKCNQ